MDNLTPARTEESFASFARKFRCKFVRACPQAFADLMPVDGDSQPENVFTPVAPLGSFSLFCHGAALLSSHSRKVDSWKVQTRPTLAAPGRSPRCARACTV